MRYSKFGYWWPQIAAIGVLAAGAVLVVLLPPHGPSVLKAILLSALTIGCVALALSCYRNADEVILQQHKAAWFWGSMIALCAVMPLTIIVEWRLLPISGLLPFVDPTPEEYFVNGVLSLLFLQLLGYSLYRFASKYWRGLP